MKKIILSFLVVGIILGPTPTFAADKKPASYDKQIAALSKKIEALEKQLEAVILKREKREQELGGGEGGVSVPAGKTSSAILKLRPSDHVRGNPNAPVVLIEYSDFECPFCKSHHATMKQIMAEYEMEGQVAWVYRHLPLEPLHPNAKKIAEASECVASQAGNDGFWKFADTIFESRATNSYTDMEKIDSYVTQAGASKKEFQKCFSGKAKSKVVSNSQAEAEVLGVSGTPQTFVVSGRKVVAEIPGAQPYAAVAELIEKVLDAQ